jgi:flagellar hook-basal body complex protein FliE
LAVDGIKGFDFNIPSVMDTKGTRRITEDAVPFSDYLKSALDKTNELLLESDKIAEDFAAGRTDNIHQVLIASEKANVALQFTMQIRNKIMDAYNEIMRMQI